VEEAKDYIESGKLELYVLGQLNAEEQTEVEEMIAKYPEVKREVEAIEFAMEQYAQYHAVPPPSGLDSLILDEIRKTTENGGEKDALIVPLHVGAYEPKIKKLRIALVACAALLVLSLVALYSAYNQLDNAKDQIASLNLEKEKFTTTVNLMKQTNADLQKIADMISDPDWKIVKLSGTKMDPNAKMVVYWHVTGKHVVMDLSKLNLPANDQEHQYQLWALVNGKPVDLGVFDVKPNATQILANMKEIASAQTFAVTLEKRGGSASPTMKQMIVAGNVSI
jgi:anti-sigma-K factor RskA